MKLAIPFLLAKFAFANLAAKLFVVTLLNYGVVVDIFSSRKNNSSSEVVFSRYFVFNRIYFSIKSSSCSQVSNSRYFVFNVLS